MSDTGDLITIIAASFMMVHSALNGIGLLSSYRSITGSLKYYNIFFGVVSILFSAVCLAYIIYSVSKAFRFERDFLTDLLNSNIMKKPETSMLTTLNGKPVKPYGTARIKLETLNVAQRKEDPKPFGVELPYIWDSTSQRYVVVENENSNIPVNIVTINGVDYFDDKVYNSGDAANYERLKEYYLKRRGRARKGLKSKEELENELLQSMLHKKEKRHIANDLNTI